MSKNLFNTVQMKAPGRNQFDLTHDVKLSCDMGNLVPVCVIDCVPGDKFRIGAEALIRFAPLVAPVMHRFDVSIHYFFVPNRILWDGWEEWITDPNSTRVFPTLAVGGSGTNPVQIQVSSLMDYMGLPTDITNGYEVNALPLAAYQKIYNDYYRDQNLIPEIDLQLVDGAQNMSGTAPGANCTILRKRAWSHDYFTSCLPFAQKGASVDIPLGSVVLDPANSTAGIWREVGNYPAVPPGGNVTSTPTTGVAVNAGMDINYDPNGTLQVDPTTITDLRRAFKLQEWLEIQARGGTRYTEQIRAQFNVVSSDARLQRPEYITGVKQPVMISEVLSTADGGWDERVPLAAMGGHGIAAISGKVGSYYCEEHGYIIGIMSVMPMTAYQQGIAKHFLKTNDQFEYYWPSFAHIGEQAVLNSEIYADATVPSDTFGYIPRYSEYKFVSNRVAGSFRDTLSTWHAGRIFDNQPALNQQFVECDATSRIFAVETYGVDSLYCHVLNKVHAVRPMPKYGNPYM